MRFLACHCELRFAERSNLAGSEQASQFQSEIASALIGMLPRNDILF